MLILIKVITFLMKNLLHLLFLPLILAGCAPTGDWNQDTFFFSPALAEKRLDTMRFELHQIRAETAAANGQAREVEGRLAAAKTERKISEADLKAMQRSVQEMERKEDKLVRRLNTLRSADALITGEEVKTERELEQLRRKVTKMRADLLLILQHR